jgi:NADP-dependent 3-hydroxy acid dehydrogenase YdfG
VAGAIIVGVGPGIGAAVTRRVAREGLAVGVIARRETTVDAGLEGLSDADALGITWRLHQQPAAQWQREVVMRDNPCP